MLSAAASSRCLAFCLALPLSCAQAQDTALPPDLAQNIQRLIGPPSAASAPASASTPAPAMPRFEIELGRLDPRLRLAPCIKIQPYLPPGVRLWGRSRVGLRCVQGAVAWNVYLPVTVKAWSTAVVARRGLPAQTVLNAEDLSLAEVDIAAESSPVVTLLPEATGRTTNRVLQPGEALRQVDLKQRQWFAAGDTVRLTLQGEGFNVMQEGIAITPGIEGQAARIRTDNGKVITAFPSGPKAASVEP